MLAFHPMFVPSPDLEITDNPGVGGHVGFAPSLWAFAPWEYATDSGLFNGRWDDQLGQFRTLYTADSLRACFVELLARFRPAAPVLAGLEEIENDDGSVDDYEEAPDGTVGYSWLNGREYGSAMQSGRYCFITHSRTVAALQRHYRFEGHGMTVAEVDTALLKDARDRVLTRSIAHWLYDLRDDDRAELVEGVESPITPWRRHAHVGGVRASRGRKCPAQPSISSPLVSPRGSPTKPLSSSRPLSTTGCAGTTDPPLQFF